MAPYQPTPDELLWFKRQQELGMRKSPPVRKKKWPPEPAGFRDWIRATYPGGELVTLPNGIKVTLPPGDTTLLWSEYITIFPEVVARYRSESGPRPA